MQIPPPMLFHVLDSGPDRVAPFSHAVSIGPWAFTTGQMPTDPKDNSLPLSEGVGAQTRALMENLKIVLAGIGCDLTQVAFARVFLTEFQRDYAAMKATAASVLAMFAAWEAAVRLLPISPALLAPPSAVMAALSLHPALLLEHGLATARETGLGFLLVGGIGAVLSASALLRQVVMTWVRPRLCGDVRRHRPALRHRRCALRRRAAGGSGPRALVWRAGAGGEFG